MDPQQRAPDDNWSRVQEIFLAAADLPEAERPRFVEAACLGNAELRAEVESLLLAEQSDGASLAAAIGSEASLLLEDPLLDDPPLTNLRLGTYRLKQEIGKGGMGSVYLAERDDDQYRKLVAIKVVKRGMETAEVLSRFRHERQILANLDHPYIARLIDAGTTPDGRPYFVMEYVEGRTIDTYCSDHDLNVEQRLRLFLRVCEAVSYAHRGLVVHRDLKPGNILVTSEGVPKLLDFGVAKLLAAGPDFSPTITGSRSSPLTPEYASPEQVRGLAVTTATDVYALGVVLYELLTGTKAQKITTGVPGEIERIVCETEAPRPSTVASEAGVPSRLRGDLDNIVLMAMRKDRERRYQSVDQLSGDLQRHLDGLPVTARQDSLTYRGGKYLRRHRVAAAAAGLILASLLGGVIVSAREARLADAARGLAEAQQRAAERERARAEVEAQVAKTERDRSERRLTQMVELAERSLSDVHSAIEALPGATDARRQVVATTLQFLESLSKDAGQDDRLGFVLSSAYGRLADVQGYPLRPNLGDSSGALANYQKSLELIGPLLAKEPDNPQYLLQQLQVVNRRAEVLLRVNQPQTALHAYEEALPAAHKLARLRPRDLESRLQEAIIYGGIAESLNPTDTTRALRNARSKVELLRQIVKEFPDAMAAQIELADAYGLTELALATRGELAEANEQVRQAILLREAVVARNPADTVARRGLMITYAHLAANLGNPAVPNLGDTAGARESYGKVVAIARQLAAADPNDRLAQTDLANALVRYAMVAPPGENPADSLATLGEARKILETLLASNTNPFSTARTLALAEEYIGRRLGETGRFQQALAAYRESLATTERLLASNASDLSLVSQALADEEAISEALASHGDRAEAAEMARKAVARAERFSAPESTGTRWRTSIGNAYATLASVYTAPGDCKDAVAAAERSLSELRNTPQGNMAATARAKAEAVLQRCASR